MKILTTFRLTAGVEETHLTTGNVKSTVWSSGVLHPLTILMPLRSGLSGSALSFSKRTTEPGEFTCIDEPFEGVVDDFTSAPDSID